MRYLASFRGGSPATIAAHVSEGFRNQHLSALGTGSDGREEYLRRLPDFLSAFTDRAYAVDDVLDRPGAGDDEAEVVVRYRFTATYDGQRIDIPGVMWFRVAGGQIVERVDVWDSLTFLVQTGQR